MDIKTSQNQEVLSDKEVFTENLQKVKTEDVCNNDFLLVNQESVILSEQKLSIEGPNNNNNQQHLKQQGRKTSQLQQKADHNKKEKSQLSRVKGKIQKYLIVSYYCYVLDHHSSTNQIFDKKQIFKKPLINLTLFLKFYKDFHLKQILQVSEIIKIFKNQAINHLWLDVDLFVQIIMKIIYVKENNQSSQNQQMMTNQNETVQKYKKLLLMFDKQNVNNLLKGKNKQLWMQIFSLYKQRKQTKMKPQQLTKDKSNLIGKFLERNFSKQVPKWLQKKQKIIFNINKQQSQKIKDKSSKVYSENQHYHQKNHNFNQKMNRYLVAYKNLKIVPSQKDRKNQKVFILEQEDFWKTKKQQSVKSENNKRTQNQISKNIQRLRSKSQKSLSKLKNLIKKNQDIKDQKIVDKLIMKKTNKFEQNQNREKLKQKNINKINRKNKGSIQKEILNYLNQEDFRLLKSQKDILFQQLKFFEEESFLYQYFNNENHFKNKNKYKNQNQKHPSEVKKIKNKSLQNLKKQAIEKHNSLNVLPKLPLKSPKQIQQPLINKKQKYPSVSPRKIYRKNNLKSQPTPYQYQNSNVYPKKQILENFQKRNQKNILGNQKSKSLKKQSKQKQKIQKQIPFKKSIQKLMNPKEKQQQNILNGNYNQQVQTLYKRLINHKL